MKNYVTGITAQGEQLRFERWLHEAYIRREVSDAFLLECLNRCVRFVKEY
jgi:hypothetical protein